MASDLVKGIQFIQWDKLSEMSQAFVKEEEGQWLHDIDPTLHALIVYLTRENNGVRVYERKQTFDREKGKEVYEMSNGLSYTKDEEGRWTIVW